MLEFNIIVVVHSVRHTYMYIAMDKNSVWYNVYMHMYMFTCKIQNDSWFRW